jgi:hypothetical protein
MVDVGARRIACVRQVDSNAPLVRCLSRSAATVIVATDSANGSDKLINSKRCHTYVKQIIEIMIGVCCTSIVCPNVRPYVHGRI